MQKATTMTFADKAREINNRYKIKSSKDLMNLDQVDLRSYNTEMERLKQKQEEYKASIAPTPNPAMPPQIQDQQPQSIQIENQPDQQGAGQGQMAKGGYVKKYLDGSTITPTNEYDKMIDANIDINGYDAAGNYKPFKGSTKMTQGQLKEINELSSRLNNTRNYINSQKYDLNKGINEYATSDPELKSRLFQARKDQSRLNELTKGVAGTSDYGSLGNIEGAFKGNSINDKYTVGDFMNNTYWGNRSQAYGVTASAKPTDAQSVKNPDGTYSADPNYRPYKPNIGIDAASAITAATPYMTKTQEKPIVYSPVHPATISYAPERQMAQEEANLQGSNLERGLVNSGSSAGMTTQGMIQGRLGLARQAGNKIGASFEKQANENAGIMNNANQYNTGLLNTAIDKNYHDSRYAEELNQLKNQQVGKIGADLGQNIQNRNYDAYIINSAGKSNAYGDPKYNWKPNPITATAPIATAPVNQTPYNFNNPVYMPPSQPGQVQLANGGTVYYKGGLLGKYSFKSK